MPAKTPAPACADRLFAAGADLLVTLLPQHRIGECRVRAGLAAAVRVGEWRGRAFGDLWPGVHLDPASGEPVTVEIAGPPPLSFVLTPFANDDGTATLIGRRVTDAEDARRCPPHQGGAALADTALQSAQEALERRRQIERLIIAVSGEFFRLDPTQIEEAIPQAMRTIADFLQAPRGVLYVFEEHQERLTRFKSWPETEEEGADQDFPPRLDPSGSPQAFEALYAGSPRFVPRRDLAPLARASADPCPAPARVSTTDGPDRLLVLPLPSGLAAGGLAAFLVPDRVALDGDDLEALRLIGATIGNALGQRNFEIFRAESQERLNGILNSLDDAVWAVDAQTDQLLFANPCSERILGRTLVDLFANPWLWFEVAHPDDRERVSHWRREIEDNGQAEYEYRFLRPEGEVRWLHLRLWTALSVSGAPSRIDGLATDRTERVAAEERVRSQQILLSNLIDHLQSGILVTDEKGRVTHLNSQFAQMLGIPRDEAGSLGLDLDWTEYLAQHRALRPDEFRRTINRLVTERQLVVGLELDLRAGQTVEQDFIPLFIDEQFKGNVWHFRDITPRKQAAQAIQEARDKEVQIAGQIQQTLLIGQPPKGIVGAQLASMTVPSRGIDGDFIDFLLHRPTCFDLLIGDVMGKGIPAAMIGAATKSAILRSLARLAREQQASEPPSPVDLINLTHAQLTRQLIHLHTFLTLCYARFDLERGRMQFVDCGHTKTVHYRAATDSAVFLSQDACPLGFMEHETYSQTTVDLQDGDIFLFYSDGLTEATDPAGEMFSLENLEQAVREFRSLTPDHLVNQLHQRLVDFTRSRKFEDDLTFVVVKIDRSTIEGGMSSCAEAEFWTAPESLDKIRDFVRNVLGQSQGVMLGEEGLEQLILAVSEASANIIFHAYGGRTDRRFRIQVWMFDNRVEVWLLYQGPSFTPPKVIEPTLGEGKSGGFGLFLIQQAVDEVTYDRLDSETSRIALVKFPAAGPRKDVHS